MLIQYGKSAGNFEKTAGAFLCNSPKKYTLRTIYFHVMCRGLKIKITFAPVFKRMYLYDPAITETIHTVFKVASDEFGLSAVVNLFGEA